MQSLSVLRLVLALLLAAPGLAGAATDYSVAEQALFMDDHLGKLKPPLVLQYAYRKSGTLEEPFEDKVTLGLTAQPDGQCCAVGVAFFQGPRMVGMPQVESARGNPAILYFLEHDIREMERLTKGKANYFRKRIRMAVYRGASVRDITLPYRGQPVAVREISISPYLDDPNRARFEKLAGKKYVFLLSNAVPGGLYGIRTRIDAESAGAAPLLAEEMVLDGAQRQP